MGRIHLATAALAALALSSPAPTAPARDTGLKVERVVLLMRHGVRPPTKEPAMPVGVAAQPWPTWDVQPGWLTQRGTRAIRLVGAADRQAMRETLPPKQCPAPDAVRVIADSDQRTIATAQAWGEGFAPGCRIAAVHLPQGQPDPAFNVLDMGKAVLDPSAADAAVLAAAGPRGIAGVEQDARPLLDRLDRILCGGATIVCGVSREPSGVTAARPDKRPKLTGALDRASTAAQILLLEYADGKAMKDVGWGRATAADIAALSRFHAVEFNILARPLAIAAPNLALIGPMLLDPLRGDAGPAITVVVGHDTNVANLGGLLGLHWQVPGLAADDPSPGGAIALERLSDSRGALFVRASYRSQTIEQIRGLMSLTGTIKPYRVIIPIPGCSARGVAGLCSLADFTRRMTAQPR